MHFICKHINYIKPGISEQEKTEKKSSPITHWRSKAEKLKQSQVKIRKKTPDQINIIYKSE